MNKMQVEGRGNATNSRRVIRFDQDSRTVLCRFKSWTNGGEAPYTDEDSKSTVPVCASLMDLRNEMLSRSR